MDDSEEYLNKKDKVSHETPKIIANLYDKANIIPKYVATPFPPLKFNHTGKICPTRHASAAR
jgi:hypothetical protein